MVYPPAVCFLLGLPRSGTTLLAHLMQQHPDITAPPEPWIMLALKEFGRVEHRHPAGASMIKTATSEFLARIDRTIVSRAFADAAYGQYLAAAGKRIIIDKTPRYWMVLDFLETLYPETPHILLMRNPYAVAASLKSTWGIPLSAEPSYSVSASSLADLLIRVPDNIASALADLVLGLPKLAAHRTRPQTQVVRYERLVAQPDAEVRRVVVGLGCDPTISSPGTNEKTAYLQSSSFGDRKILDKQAVDDRSVQAWQNQLSVEEMQTVTDLVGADLLVDLGYEQELGQAQQAGVVDRGREVTELYRRVFEIWWDLRCSDGGATGLVPNQSVREPTLSVGQPTQSSFRSSDLSKNAEAQHMPRSETEDASPLTNSTGALLRQALLASEADRAAQLDTMRDRDIAIDALRREIARLERALNNGVP
ncbi:sulfotransferase family protein [Bradyrhizobium sp. CCGE-LA001]|uniref:nodulation protein NoeE n=1 Tax=Bradyrhizobium sp. CCGE-LA001 TaxID=1223566 RepID=UPI00030B8C05|nr:sulfotransferase [Bradyrhizobium sp. CCGE-LA001]AMA59869.1 Nodulation protein NoeE [Bradyrhizobium sp. CCGE-LA001]